MTVVAFVVIIIVVVILVIVGSYLPSLTADFHLSFVAFRKVRFGWLSEKAEKTNLMRSGCFLFSFTYLLFSRHYRYRSELRALIRSHLSQGKEFTSSFGQINRLLLRR